jgi:HSP90 family molecular chaperone
MTSSDVPGFKVGIEFDSVLSAISKQIYETPLAFIRENVQNAVDALRMQAERRGLNACSPPLAVHVVATADECEIRDNGIGMSLDDLQNLFWTIGASGKRTEEARAAGCVGMFGIGGFANFGVCDDLVVTSQQELPQVTGHAWPGRRSRRPAAQFPRSSLGQVMTPPPAARSYAGHSRPLPR